HMADTLREVTIGRGHDPRDFVLFAYGGAGPVHCAGFGAELGVRKIIVPATSMAHSAYGALASDIYKSVELSEPMPCASSSAERIDAIFNELEREACTGILRAGIKEEDTEVVRSAGMLYHRQVNDLSITFPSGTVDANMISTV